MWRKVDFDQKWAKSAKEVTNLVKILINFAQNFDQKFDQIFGQNFHFKLKWKILVKRLQAFSILAKNLI